MASQRDTETIEATESRKRAVAERAQQRRLIFTRNTWGIFDKAAFGDHPDRVPRGEYERRFNAPTTNEIAVVVVSSERTASRDIFLVDMYVKVESKRLRFIGLNQTKLRAENYIYLQDAIRNDADLDPNNLGQMGPTNFSDLKTVDGQELETFRQAYEKLGLLEDDNHWDATMEEAVLCEIASETSVYNSIDTVMSSVDTTSYPVEFMNSLELSGVPSCNLELNVGVPVLLMRNLDGTDYAMVLGCESPN
ncbi:helitron_like_N domain-containing protein [Trichonephila clavipes]|nr:helitron_like_N domain-containing protein [Trichonephila clavipes]